MSIADTSAILRSRKLFVALLIAFLAASSHESGEVPTSSMILYTLSDMMVMVLVSCKLLIGEGEVKKSEIKKSLLS